jgi:hypothetical protein
MDEASGGDGLSFLNRRLPRSFEARVIDLAPAGVRAYEAAEWPDALVVVEHGEIELEGLHGTRRRFGRGAVLWLEGLSVRAIHNSGAGTALLVAVARRRS